VIEVGCGVAGCAGVNHPVGHSLRGRKWCGAEGGGEGLRRLGWQGHRRRREQRPHLRHRRAIVRSS
jgi:hypothetical protein